MPKHEDDPATYGVEVGRYTNTEDELAVIVKRPDDVRRGGELLLCFIDNQQSGSLVPMLLDAGTAEWIARVFAEHGKHG